MTCIDLKIKLARFSLFLNGDPSLFLCSFLLDVIISAEYYGHHSSQFKISQTACCTISIIVLSEFHIEFVLASITKVVINIHES